jgi:hypothetical protein
MVNRREDGQIGIFSFCLPVDISSATGCCQNSWSHAKAQRRKVRTEGSHFQQFSLAPLREVKAGIDESFEHGLIGIISFCLPVSLTPFHHPSFALPAPPVARKSTQFGQADVSAGQTPAPGCPVRGTGASHRFRGTSDCDGSAASADGLTLPGFHGHRMDFGG